MDKARGKAGRGLTRVDDSIVDGDREKVAKDETGFFVHGACDSCTSSMNSHRRVSTTVKLEASQAKPKERGKWTHAQHLLDGPACEWSLW